MFSLIENSNKKWAILGYRILESISEFVPFSIHVSLDNFLSVTLAPFDLSKIVLDSQPLCDVDILQMMKKYLHLQ